MEYLLIAGAGLLAVIMVTGVTIIWWMKLY